MNDEQKMIDDAIAQFPKEFGLRAWPSDRFAISREKSYVNSSGEVQLVAVIYKLDTWTNRVEWMDFAKGTPAELLAQAVHLSK